jgi:uncharacterized protein (DUF302 family)
MNHIKVGLISTMLLFFNLTLAKTIEVDGLLIKPSKYSVKETLDRLETILKKKGVTVFVRIDHAQGAQKAGVHLGPTELIIFGNPKLGSPLMQSNSTAAIDLPLKAIAWKDERGKVWLGYNTPEYITRRHVITDRTVVVKKIKGALNKFSDFATK